MRRALVSALFLAACGGGDVPGPADGREVELLNFSQQPVSIIFEGEPISTATLIAPNGERLVLVDDTIGASTKFTATDGPRVFGTKTCTVTDQAWISVNPSVVLQPTFGLDCLDW